MHVINPAAIVKGKFIKSSASCTKVLFILGCLFIFGGRQAFAQVDTTAVPELAPLGTDSLPADSASFAESKKDTIAEGAAGGGSPLTDIIKYSARDSIKNDVINRKVYLYGDAEVNFGTITLKAERIVYNFERYEVHAEGVQDSAGVWTGIPKFSDAGEEYDAFMMDYNFKSKKAYIKKVETAVIEGTLTGRDVKIIDGGEVIYIAKGEYCPCEDPNAKTRFKISKLKVIKDDKIVSGPGYLSFYGIPTPLAFPFGFFPNTEKRQAGLIIPSYGNGQTQGYFLNNLGFYMPINDNIDTRILADIYSRGSWGLANATSYRKRYVGSGDFRVDYNEIRLGDRELGTFEQQNVFFITWRHTQDPKRRPMSNFSADVSAGSTQAFRNNLNASQNDFLSNTFRSNIRYQQNFYDSPWSLAMNLGHDQNSVSGNYNFTLPNIAINRMRTFPLKELFQPVGRQKWYHKFGLTYSSTIQNTLSVNESELRMNNLSALSNQFRNGMRHQVAVANSLKAGPFTINPSFNYTGRMYMQQFDRVRDPDSGVFLRDTIQGFAYNDDWGLSAAITTKLYGMYSFKQGKVSAIRHTMTPSFSLSYRPDFDTRIWGFFSEDGSLTSFSPFENQIFGFSPSGQQGSIGFSLINNLEAKVLSRRDSTSKFAKVAILENLTVNGSYNIAADSLNLSILSVSGRTKLTKYANLVFRGSFDPYSYVAVAERQVTRVNTFLVDKTGQLASFETGNIAINASGISSTAFERRNKEPVVQQEDDEQEKLPRSPLMQTLSGFKVPWNLSFGYAFDARRVRTPFALEEDVFAIRDSIAIVQSIQMNGSFDFFKRVKVNFNTGYDFLNKELIPTTLVFVVDLNCWELNARYVPFGIRRSYMISLNIKSQMLKDLKFEQNRNLNREQQFFF